MQQASFVANWQLQVAASKLASWHCHDRGEDTPTYLIYRYTFHFSKAAPRCVCVKGEKANASA